MGLAALAFFASVAVAGATEIEVTAAPVGVAPVGRAEFLGGVALSASHPLFGGLSGLELSGDAMIAPTDKGHILTGRLLRGPDGVIIGLAEAELRPALDAAGEPVRGAAANLEAVALGTTGGFYLGYEGENRVAFHARAEAPARVLPRPDGFDLYVGNSGIEAVATGADGAVYAIPERSGDLERPFPVYRWRGEAQDAVHLPRRPPFLPTGADIGPDGRLWVLERDFAVLRGFAVRVRRAEIPADSDALLEDETVFEIPRFSGGDNYEGIDVRRATGGGGYVVTLVSDDNLNMFQESQIVEFLVPD